MDMAPASVALPSSQHWQPAPSGDGYLEGVADVQQCIHNVLVTPKGSSPTRPNFGSNLYLYIDRPINQARPHLVRESVDPIREFEPRAIVTRVEILTDALNAQTFIRPYFKLADGVVEHFVDVRP